MTEDAAHISCEAKRLHQSLKESLETRDPWDREVEFQRRNLRRQYLRLLFQHPYAPECKDTETHLWMQTSYQFISKYKRRVTELDRIVHGPSPSRQQQQQIAQAGQPRNPGGHGVVEYRKTLQRFRQFLAEEEKFWRQFAVRIRRLYSLDDAQSALIALNIALEEEPTNTAEGAPSRRFNPFPADADIVLPDPTSATAEQRESWLSTFTKALICLGDIERYKELYNEAGGRPRAGHENGPPVSTPGRGGRNRRGGGPIAVPPTVARARNYAQARAFYEQARLLQPHDGHPFHQMAILDSYQDHKLDALYYYYRALCVRQPFETAQENLNSALHKALDRWKADGGKKAGAADAHGDGSAVPAYTRVKLLAEKLFILHASWKLPDHKSQVNLSDLGRQVINDFKGLVAERAILTEIITKAIVLGQGALWIHRAMRPSASSNASGKSSSSRTGTEAQIAAHILAMHRTLLDVGSAEIEEIRNDKTGNDKAGNDLAQRISATFRRTLPALRVASKWLRAHSRYISQGQHASSADAAGSGNSDGSDSPDKGRQRRSVDGRDDRHTLRIAGADGFWTSYAAFLDALSGLFPRDRLPSLNVPLEEDTDLIGFLPLRKFLDLGTPSGRAAKEGAGRSQARSNQEQVHPNEEQLMRITDLVEDAKALADAEECPMMLKVTSRGSKFMIPQASRATSGDRPTRRGNRKSNSQKPTVEARPPPPEPPRPQMEVPLLPQPIATTPAREIDSITVSSKTDDDPCADAVRMALAGSLHDTEEEDEIVYMKDDSAVLGVPSGGFTFNKAPGSPPHEIPSMAALPVLKPSSPLTPRFGAVGSPNLDVSPPRQQDAHVPIQKGTTAADLLRALEQSSSGFGRSQHTRGHSASSFLGSGAIGSASHSIWSPTHGSTSLMTVGQGEFGRSSLLPNYQSQHHPAMLSSAQTLPPSFPSQSSQQFSQGLAPAASLPPQIYSSAEMGHYRSLSHPEYIPQPLSQNPSYDPFGSYPVDINGSQYATGVPATYPDHVYAGTAPSYQQHVAYQDQLHPRHHDHRDVHASLLFSQRPPISQIWNNTG
ncbi:hypothetical protein CERSUDRAFT_115057 [Gelatoporia subvermispora B]|uniref:DNA/RNA-binding domain-containing protein n=1 Tax=Ceriporiopsis subvermispora (strain B) TaxID=914234 RepID=M2RE87_CERS8|nr:hypothetical protein CERSUDRAFT_115057 [Gelatoporia subvermispora B]